MSLDIENPTLSRIYTANENIKGILQRLAGIMDERAYSELYSRYLELSKEIPKDEVLTDSEKIYNAFGTDLKYSELDIKIRNFEKELNIYNEYKELSDLLNEIKKLNNDVFNDDFVLENLILKNQEFIDLIIQIKNDKAIKQFTTLLDEAIKTVFYSMKSLTVLGNGELINYVNKTYSDFLKEHLGSLVREDIDTTSYKGSLDEDYVDFETLHECAINDTEIISHWNEVNNIKEREKAIAKEREERIASLKEERNNLLSNIKKYQDELKRLKLSSTSLKAKRLFYKLVVIPAIALPLSCPFIGRHFGIEASSKVFLTRTITNTVDTDTGKIVATEDEYKELMTDYVASVTICEPWKKNVSGTSYTRECAVYDYDFSDFGDIDDDFHLTLADIDPERLVKKYNYEEPTATVENEKYLTEQQVYITETYQDANDKEVSTKYIVPYMVAGIGTGILLGTTELLVYLLFGNKISDKLKKKLEENEEKIEISNKTLKKSLGDVKTINQEYESLTGKSR